MTSYTLTIGIHKAIWLTANQRLHWSTRMRRTRMLRAYAASEARIHGLAGRRLSPSIVTAMIGYPTNGRADPTNAETYKKNAASMKSQMEALSKKLVDGTAKCQHKEFVTSHEAFGYLADRTGLTQLGLSGLDPDSTPFPARLKQISDAVKAKGITTIFTEELLSPKVAETLAKDLGITTAVLDPIESQADDSKDYEAVMNENLEALQKALSCE